MTVNAVFGLALFVAGGFYAEHDWIRLTVIAVVCGLLWMLRDELRSRA